MKALYAFALALAVAACSAPQDADRQDSAASSANGGFSEDNLAASDACFSDTPSALLEPGQTLIERGPSGIVLVSHALDGEAADYEFQVSALPDAQRRILDDAAAQFFRMAGDQYDPATDAVIYHRARDGAFCAVVRDATAGRGLADAAAAVDAALADTPAE